MKELIFNCLGSLYSKYLINKNPRIFKTGQGKEYLQMYAVSEVKMVFFRALALLNNYKLIDNYIDNKKKTDTVFILGSGDSINELTHNDWSLIKKNNIIGLNYSFVHPIIPDYHFMEMIPQKEMHDFFREETEKRYSEVDMFFQFKHIIKSGFNLRSYKFKNRAFVHIPHLYPTIYPEILQLYLNDHITKYGLKKSNLIHHNSHIGCAVMFAQSLGYKNVVLLGIDLNGGAYFTDSNIKSKEFPCIDSYDRINRLRKKHFKSVNEYQNSKHPTVDPKLLTKRGAVSMDEYFKVYNDVMVLNSDTKLYTGSNTSLLAKYLPVYPFESNLDK